MPDTVPENDQLPQEDQAETQEQEAIQTQAENENLIGSIAALFPSIAAEFYGLKEDITQDKRYKKIVEKRVREWKEGHPDLFEGETFIKRRRDGKVVINPKLEELIPNLEELARRDFEIYHPRLAKRYKEKERQRIYEDHNDDPALQRLQRSIERQLPQRFWTPAGVRQPVASTDQNQTVNTEQTEIGNRRQSAFEQREEEEHKQYKDFVRHHPTKARHYASKDPKIKKAFEEWKEEEWAKKSRAQRIFQRYNQPYMVPDSQKKAWMPKRLRALSDKYDEKKEKLKHKVAQRFAQSRLGRAYKRVDAAINRVLSPFTRAQEYIDRQINKAIDKALHHMFRPFKAAGRLGGRVIGRLGGNWVKGRVKGAFGRIPRVPTPHMPTVTNLLSRATSSVARSLGSGIRAGGRGTYHAGSALLKSSSRMAIRIGGRLAAGAAASTAPVWLPGAIIGGVVGLILLIIIIIIIIILTMNSGEVSVSIQKSGPTQVDNYVATPAADLEEDPNLLTYTLSVSYTGASSIRVVDTLPPEVEYVSSTGPVQPTVSGNVITWNIPVQGSTGGSSIPGGAAGTIHNMGFGPSDAARIESLISSLRPDSPLLGHGQTVIDYANEFNIDPLMIIIFLNESGFCADNGVVSPGGSNPDNYNCGGITWPAAQDATDVARWNAEQGPFANGHYFTFVPTPQDGIGLYFDYLGGNSLYEGKDLYEFYDIYNPCSDPGNGGRFACGREEMQHLLDILEQNL